MGDQGCELFAKRELRELIDAKQKSMINEIDSIDGNRLLNSNVDDLCNYFEEKYKIESLQIKEDQITTEQRETQIDISQNEDFIFFNGRSGPYYVKGTAISYYIPFEGDNDLFNFRPSRYYMGFTSRDSWV